jgi:protein ImuB
MFACVHVVGSQVRCLDELVVLARGFTPLVEETSPDTVVLDIAGCERLFGSPRRMGQEIARRASQSELKASVAVAGNPDVAVCAAMGLPGFTFISQGREAAALARLPVGLLRVAAAIPAKLRLKPGSAEQAELAPAGTNGVAASDDDALRRLDEILETLDLWGIRTFGELAALPEAGLSERLGQPGVRLRKLALGENQRPLLLEGSEPEFQKSIELDDPVELLEPLSFILSGLLESLCTQLKSRALAASEITLRMRLEDRSVYERVIRLPFPMRSSKVFVRLLALEIESDPPQSAIVAVAVSCEPVEPRSLQNGLFQPLAPEPEKLELTLIRLMKLVGPENVGSPEILDTHRPDAFRIHRFRLKRERGVKARIRSRGGSSILNLRSSMSSKALASIPRSTYRLGFRVFRPPLRADVEYRSGRPARIRAVSEMQSRVLRGRVSEAAGPWRTSGDWWRADCWARDEWDVSIAETGALYRIYRDLRSGGWFVEGVYD